MPLLPGPRRLPRARPLRPAPAKREILAALLSRPAVAGAIVGVLVVVAAAPFAQGATTIAWKGHTWQVTSGGMAGVCQGDPDNVSVDANGYLHFKISSAGGTWTAAEMFTTDKLGFGTYQWQVDGPIDTYDKNVVLGLFPYGPAAGIGADGTNEIDIEYSRWGRASGANGDWTDYPASGTTIGERSYTFSLGGSTLSTSRFSWSRTGITSSLFGGLTAVDSTAGLLETWPYMPANPTVNIPQQALPLGMNLWCFDAPPSDGKPVEIVIRDFQFVPEGSSPGTGGSGAGGGGAAGGRGGLGGSAGSTVGGGGGRGTGSGGGVGGGAGARTGSGGGAGGRGGQGGSRPATGGEGTGGAGLGSGGVASTGGTVSGSGGTISGSGGSSAGSGGASAGSGGASGGATPGAAGTGGGCDCAMAGTDLSAGRWAVPFFLTCALCARRRRSRPHR